MQHRTTTGTRWREDHRCAVIYNGVDLSRFDAAVDRRAVRAAFGITPESTLYLHVGRVSPPKNHGRLLAIFSMIRNQTPSAKLLLVGSGPNENSLLSLIGSLGLADSVILAGPRTDVPALMRSAEVLLLPSLREGLPGVVLEACAVGLPVLASDLPGVREIATRLPLVRYLPLSATDATWATTARELFTQPEWLQQQRDCAPGVFGRSVFQLDRAVEGHCALWRRAAGNALPG